MSEYKQEIFERYVVGLTAIVVGITIAIVAEVYAKICSG